ncbi:glycerophosphodiester phosphodiesterase family protein [Alphaproteobacteria bacterium]|nr:glycerophosphodiester phosphodiesterase family protein [Alphaproteobacteria bacterium]
MNLTKLNHIKIYGHRGARGDLPENTLNSFQYLFDYLISAYETDILISKDLIPVIAHDFKLDPSFTQDNNGEWITDENIKIFDLTYEELSKYDVGTLNKLSKYGRNFVNQKSLPNQKIPKLDDLLNLTARNQTENLIINLEIKSTPAQENFTPLPQEMVKLVLDVVNNSALKDKIIYSSFDWRVLREVRDQNPHAPRAYLTELHQSGSKISGTIYDQSPWMDFIPLKNAVELPRLIASLGGRAWHPYYRDISKKMIDISHEENLAVNVWTVNDEDDMLKMIEYGVDGIITDYPLRLKNLCEKNNISWF